MANNFFEQDDYTGNFDTGDIENNKVVSAIGYVPVLFLVPLLGAPQSPFAKFHANQGLILTILSIVLGVAGKILGTLFKVIPLFRHFVPEIVSAVCSVAVLAYMVIGIITASQGKAKKLPFIGGIIDIFN